LLTHHHLCLDIHHRYRRYGPRGQKIVLTGDIYQIDHPYLDSQANGLSYLIEKMQGKSIDAHVNLEKGERS